MTKWGITNISDEKLIEIAGYAFVEEMPSSAQKAAELINEFSECTVRPVQSVSEQGLTDATKELICNLTAIANELDEPKVRANGINWGWGAAQIRSAIKELSSLPTPASDEVVLETIPQAIKELQVASDTLSLGGYLNRARDVNEIILDLTELAAQLKAKE